LRHREAFLRFDRFVRLQHLLTVMALRLAATASTRHLSSLHTTLTF
jgi:hypothetical protein